MQGLSTIENLLSALSRLTKIIDKSEVKKYTELAIVLKARSISLSSLSLKISIGVSLSFTKAR